MPTQTAFVVKGTTGTVQSVPVPTPAEGECLIRVLVAGICNTDIEILKGYSASFCPRNQHNLDTRTL